MIIKTIGNIIQEEHNLTGISALELLQINHNLQVNSAGIIKCIDGICAENDYWWQFYINDEWSTIGSKTYIVKDKDKIGFIFGVKQ